MKTLPLLPLATATGVAILLSGCVVESPAYVPPPHAVVRAVVVVDAPPPLPVYDIPPCPGDGLHWVPGYWAWADGGYYWVPGTWVRPPRMGVVWTPGYWSFEVGGRYAFHEGYWGEHVGFYGGINYGGGYVGTGFVGGRWEGGAWRVNAAVYQTVNVRNVYHETVVNNVTRVSYSGGAGGARAVPTPEERRAEQIPHVPATEEQASHVRQAAAMPELQAHHNQGRPAVFATAAPGVFTAVHEPVHEVAREPVREPAHEAMERHVDRPPPPSPPPPARKAPAQKRPAEKAKAHDARDHRGDKDKRSEQDGR